MSEPLHIVPENDLREHVADERCWCNPECDREYNLYIHNALDQREQYESGRRKLQ